MLTTEQNTKDNKSSSWLNKNRKPLTLGVVATVVHLLLPAIMVLMLGNSLIHYISGLGNWDGEYYKDIAIHGYTKDYFIAFYPLYPLLIHLLVFWQLTPSTANIAGLVISLIAGFLVAPLSYKLFKLDYNGKIATNATLLIISFPTAFYLNLVYTEGIFMVLALGAFLAAKKSQWLWAAFLAALTLLTKNQGVMVVAALAVEYAVQNNWHLNKKILLKGIQLATVPALALGGWLFFNYVLFGNILAYVKAPGYWGRQLEWPWMPLWDVFSKKMWEQYSFVGPIVTILFLVLTAIAVKMTLRDKFPLSYLVYLVGCVIQPLCYPITTRDPLESMQRYFLVAFPAFLVLAILVSRPRYRIIYYLYILAAIVTMIILATLFNLDRWVA